MHKWLVRIAHIGHRQMTREKQNNRRLSAPMPTARAIVNEMDESTRRLIHSPLSPRNSPHSVRQRPIGKRRSAFRPRKALNDKARCRRCHCGVSFEHRPDTRQQASAPGSPDVQLPLHSHTAVGRPSLPAWPDRKPTRRSCPPGPPVVWLCVERGVLRREAALDHVELHDRFAERHILHDLVHGRLVVHRVDPVGIDADVRGGQHFEQLRVGTRPVKVT